MLITRTARTTCTIGQMTTDDGAPFAVTLELPWLDNAHDVSCIPTGHYTVKRRYSVHHGYEVFGVENVPNRSDIELHIGNSAKDSLGCILIGSAVGDDGESITGSKIAFQKLMTAFQGIDTFPLEIVDATA